MKKLGELIELAPMKVTIGVLLMLFAGGASLAFSAGAASVKLRDMPRRLTMVEEAVVALGESQDTLMLRFDVQDRRQWRIYCIVDMMAKGLELGPADCDPNMEGASYE